MKNKIPASEITPEELYISRRRFIKSALISTSAAALTASCSSKEDMVPEPTPASIEAPNGYSDKQGNSVITFENIASYTNFYEFSTSKTEPAKLAKGFPTSPWLRDLNTFLIK